MNSALSGSFNHSDVEQKLATANLKVIDDVAKLRDKLTGCIPSRVGAFRFVFPKSNNLTDSVEASFPSQKNAHVDTPQ